MTGGLLEAVVEGGGSRGVPLDERDGKRGLVTAQESDGGGRDAVDVHGAGSRLICKPEMTGVPDVVEGDDSRPLVGRRASWETAGSGRRRVAGDGVGSRPCLSLIHI